MTTAPSNLTQQPAQLQGHAGDAPKSHPPIPPGFEKIGYLFSLLDSRIGNLFVGVIIAAIAWHFAIAPEIKASRETLQRELDGMKSINSKLEVLTLKMETMVMQLDRIAKNGAKP